MFANACCRTGAAVLLALLGFGANGQAQVIEIDEVISREVGIHIGGVSTPDIKEIVSREASFFIENGRDDGEVISRELSVVIDAPGSPPQVTGYTVAPSPDGSSVVLNWSNYNSWAVGDVAGYRIYLSNQPFSDIAGLTPLLTVHGETLTATLAGLPAYQDQYIAIVAVDGSGNSNPAVVYSAAYILTKEVVSREVSVAFNAEPQPSYQEVVSREVSVVRDNPGAPVPITDFNVSASPIGSTATLDWSSYNSRAQYDVDHYRIYYSDTLFTSLSGIPFVDVPGESSTFTFPNLAPWTDHYFAIVPVDALGASDPAFNHGAAYAISPEVISREVSVFTGQDPPDPPPVVMTIPVANFSFETPDIANFIYLGSMSAGQRTAFAWTGAGNGGNGPALFNNGGAWGFVNVPDGSQGVGLQGDGSISRDFDLASPGSYTLTWSAASRTGQVNPYVIKLNGVTASAVYSTSNTAWQSNSATFEISASGTHSITIAGLNTSGGDNSVGIDTVSLSRFESEGNRPFGSLRELVSREVSAVRPDNTTPTSVTFAGSGFSATTARTTFGGISLDWRSYNEWAQQDVLRYRIYVSTSLFSDVAGMAPHAFSANGTQIATLSGLTPETIHYVAVVAEDVEGNFNPVVYPVSAKTAVEQLGEVANLTAVPTPTSITYSWDLGGVGDELAGFVREFRVYLDGATVPVVVDPAARNWTASALTPETSHAAIITTVDLLGFESSGISASATTPAIPPGTVEPAFNPDANGNVTTTTVQADRKILIGGSFTMIGGVARNRLARLNADFTLDSGFNPNANNTINCISLQADGKILIGGSFTSVGGTTRNRIARLNGDGSLDSGFNPNANSTVFGIAIQPDGKAVLAGAFTTIGGTTRNRIARVDASGSRDLAFNPNANSNVTSVALQADGKIILGGNFTTVGGVGRNRIARMNANGSLDTGFNPNANNFIYTAVVEPDGQILIGGEFTQVAGGERNRIARLHADGTLDTLFNPDANHYVQALALQTDGGIIAGGNFSTMGGVPRNQVVRLTSTGTVDVTFNPNAAGIVHSNALLPDGRVLIGGSFTSIGGVARNRVALLTNDPATHHLAVSGPPRVEWLRGGTSPEAQSVIFDLSTDGGGSFTPLGNATRTIGGWELPGLNLPGSGRIRARARISGGIYNGSSGLQETSVDYSGVLTPLRSWKQTHLGDPDADDLGDPDFDGLPTLVEYALETLPHIPNASPLAGTRFTYPEGERLRIFVPRNPARNDVTVEVVAAADLGGPWTPIATSEWGAPFSGPGYIAGDGTTPGPKSVEVRDIVNISDAPMRFLRVKVTH